MANLEILSKGTLALLGLMFALQGCNTSMHDIGTPPTVTHVGYDAPLDSVLIQPEPEIIRAPDRIAMEDTSLWKEKNSLFFRDTRAFEVGDILTVDISIDDSAKLDNTSGRTTDVTGSLGGTSNITLDGTTVLPDIGLAGDLNAGLELERGGTVDRKETINLQIAAVVAQASANGNLRIIGSQEVRVNHELRILTVEGIVRTKDIRPDNTIPYEKIAEARITYGGHNNRRVKRPRRSLNPLNIFRKPDLLSFASGG